MRTFLLLVLLVSSSGWAQRTTSKPQTIPANPNPSPSPAPDGWVAYRNPTELELQCANYSAREWRVSLEGERLRIRLDTLLDHQDPLPAAIKSGNVTVGNKGHRHIIAVDDGWLVGMDIGEFGGGLWWFSADGHRSKKLSDQNVAGFARTAKGILIFVGLAHLSLNEGAVLQISDGANGNQKLERLAELASAPRSFAVESPNTVIVLTTTKLLRFKTSGQIENLLKIKYNSLYPNSMTLSPSGVIHIGMRQFVTRLTPAGNTYHEEWFVPADCTKFTTRDYDCVCSASR